MCFTRHHQSVWAAWVLTNNVAPGAVLTANDATEAEVDWAADASPSLANPGPVGGSDRRPPARGGSGGARPWCGPRCCSSAGAQVRVVAQGPGYAVSSAGTGVDGGSVGQTVRVRMENGRIVSGTVNDVLGQWTSSVMTPW